MTLFRWRQSRETIRAAMPQTPVDQVRLFWSTLSPEERVDFLVDVLTPEERQALALNFAEDLPWKFVQGQHVHVAGAEWVGIVRQQRVTFRDVLGPVWEYLVSPPEGPSCWHYEADIIPVIEGKG